MAAYRRVYDMHVSLWAWWEVVAAHHRVHDYYACCHLKADCLESGISSGPLRSITSMGNLYLLKGEALRLVRYPWVSCRVLAAASGFMTIVTCRLSVCLMVTFPSARHCRPSASDKLCCFVTEACECEQHGQNHYIEWKSQRPNMTLYVEQLVP